MLKRYRRIKKKKNLDFLLNWVFASQVLLSLQHIITQSLEFTTHILKKNGEHGIFVIHNQPKWRTTNWHRISKIILVFDEVFSEIWPLLNSNDETRATYSYLWCYLSTLIRLCNISVHNLFGAIITIMIITSIVILYAQDLKFKLDKEEQWNTNTTQNQNFNFI